MLKSKQKFQPKNDLQKFNSTLNKNHNNIILISHCRNKSADLKYSKNNNSFLSKNCNLKNVKYKTNSNQKRKMIKDIKIQKDKIKSNKELQKINLKSKFQNIHFLNKITKQLKKYVSVSNLVSNKKKYFLDSEFFYRNKNKQNVNQKSNDSKKENNNNNKYNFSNNYLYNNNFNNKREINNERKLKNNVDDSKNCDISSIDNSIYNKDITDIKQPSIKLNFLYKKGKISSIPNKNKKCSSSKIPLWNQKENDSKLIKRKNESIIKSYRNIYDNSKDSNRIIYDENNNLNKNE